MGQETESDSWYVLYLYTDAEEQGKNMGELEVLMQIWNQIEQRYKKYGRATMTRRKSKQR